MASASASEKVCRIQQAPNLVLHHIAAFLPPRDIAHLAQTCRRLYAVLPSFLAMKGEDFHISRGGAHPHWAPEPYFDGPPLPTRVSRLIMSVVWEDQGWGNRKGEIYITLMRGERQVASIHGAGRGPLGIAPHKKEEARAELRGDKAVVSQAEPGDFYRFTRNVGGGGGHQLKVRKFRVVAQLI